MDKGILAVCDLDDNYTNSLIEYISNKKGIPFEVIAFTKRDELLTYLEEQSIDILLISSNLMEESIESQDIGKIILLSEGKVLSQYISYSFIFKYQSTENIIKELLSIYVDVQRNNNLISIPKGHAKIIGVYSPIGRVGKTTFALTLGQIMASREKTLYINMEEFSAFHKLFQKTYSADLSDLMYFYKQNPESISIKLQAISESFNQLEYIPPLIFSQNLRNIESIEWINLINKIGSHGDYNSIIIDLSNMVQDIFSLLEICDDIYMPINNEFASLIKVSVFEEFLLKTDREKILDKIIKIKIPESRVNNWNEEYLQQQLWGQLGDFIRKMLKEVER